MQNKTKTIDFLRELSELMQKHDAAFEIGIDWINEYEAYADLGFKVDSEYIRIATTIATDVITAKDILDTVLYQNN